MSPTARAALALAALAVAALFVPPAAALLGLAALAGLFAVDALRVRRAPELAREAPAIAVRGRPAPLRISVDAPRARVRQPRVPDLALEPAEGDGGLDTALVARRRGRHTLPVPAVRLTGPLGLAAWTHRVGEDADVLVYPDVPGARRLAARVRQGRFREEGRRRGPLGLGTEFESVRDYLPDDDIRQLNWRATARLGRPMSNQYRVERDREVVIVVDAGRLMAAPLRDGTRLDAALDAAVAVAAVAEELGDRCGAIAFAGEVTRVLNPRRRATDAVVRALFDLEPTGVDSDYAAAFQRVGGAKRAFVLVLTDLLEERAVRPLLEALPVLARRHAVTVATASDPDLAEIVAREPERPLDVYRASVALEVVAARRRVETLLRHAGAEVVDAPGPALPAACVRGYLRAKARARL
jgi:uncharacterized protein (DUF58 family)